MVSLLLVGVVNAQNLPAYVREHDNNMPVVAQVVLDETPVTSGWTLNAYVGDDLRGTAEIQPTLYNTYWIQVYYDTPAQGEVGPTVSFKITNGTEEYTSTTTLTAAPEGYGTLGTPQVIEFAATQMMTQTTAMAEGWNWFVPVVDITLEQLEEALGTNGISIMSQNSGSVIYDEDDEEWSGHLSELVQGQMYIIQVNNDFNMVLVGYPLPSITITIDIENGFNWFGYTGPEISLTQALNGFNPADGDCILGAEGSSTYDEEDEEWSGHLTSFQPGHGYIYISKDLTPKQLIFLGSRFIE